MMSEALLYLVSSLWLGAVHAATPGHGKTIAAAYIVGARGRPADALSLGIFVTLSHTSGIVLVAVLASLGLPGLVPQRLEAYLSLFTGILVLIIGLWLLLAQCAMLSAASATPDHLLDPDRRAHRHEHGTDPAHDHEHLDAPEHGHQCGREYRHDPAYHSHGWGIRHTHQVDVMTQDRPSLLVLLGLGIAGGLLPDPAALAILLSALARGKIMLGLGTVLVFSLGFASTLVVVGVVAAKVGQVVLTWLSAPWTVRLRMGTALLIIAVGVVLTVNAWHIVSALP
jgi:nickel/cobalt transporter (NicO) family protein